MSIGQGWKICLVALLAVATACTGSGTVSDSPEARLETARTLARLSVDGGSFDDALDEAAALAQAASLDTLKIELGRELSDAEQERMLEILRTVLAEFITADNWENGLAEVFAKHFTAGELQEVLEFYRSPVGAKVLELEGVMTKEIGDRADAAFDDRIEEFVGRVDEALTAEFGAGS